MKRPHRAEEAPGRRRAQPGQKERAGGSPGSGSPRRKQAERRGRRELLGDRERGSAEKICRGRRKKDGRASLREQRAPSKKEKEVRRKEEVWKQLKKHRCVVTRLQARFSPAPSLDKGQVPSSSLPLPRMDGPCSLQLPSASTFVPAQLTAGANRDEDHTHPRWRGPAHCCPNPLQ